jgi:histidinol-phosphate aminotransferase
MDAYTLSPHPSKVKLNQNENPHELSDSFKRAVVERALARPWGRYPDFFPKDLHVMLADHIGWRSDGVLVGNGSNELIEALLVVTVGQGTRVVIPEPTFTLYGMVTAMLGGEAVRVPLDAELRYDPDALSRARAQSGAAVTIVCSPNNPTGSSLPSGAVERLCEDDSGLVVIDEAYAEFSGWSAVPLLQRYSNLIVLRTLSKAGALAGLRIGYLLASPELVSEVNKARLPYSLNFFSQIAAEEILGDWEAVAERVERIVNERGVLAAALARLSGLRCYASDANFVLVELQDAHPVAVFEALAAEGILVRDVSRYPGLSRHLRISVGTPDQNAALVAALPRALALARVQVGE